MPRITPQPTGILAESAQIVAWEKLVTDAETHEQAQTQLLYLQLLQLRVIKLILVWVLIVIPIVVAVGLVILLNVDTASTPTYYR